jgi:hypothetical protein
MNRTHHIAMSLAPARGVFRLRVRQPPDPPEAASGQLCKGPRTRDRPFQYSYKHNSAEPDSGLGEWIGAPGIRRGAAPAGQKMRRTLLLAMFAVCGFANEHKLIRLKEPQ